MSIANHMIRDDNRFRALDERTRNLLQMAVVRLQLSARACDHIHKVARTMDGLVGSPTLTADHVSEAIQFRSLDCQI